MNPLFDNFGARKKKITWGLKRRVKDDDFVFSSIPTPHPPQKTYAPRAPRSHPRASHPPPKTLFPPALSTSSSGLEPVILTEICHLLSLKEIGRLATALGLNNKTKIFFPKKHIEGGGGVLQGQTHQTLK